MRAARRLHVRTVVWTEASALRAEARVAGFGRWGGHRELRDRARRGGIADVHHPRVVPGLLALRLHRLRAGDHEPAVESGRIDGVVGHHRPRDVLGCVPVRDELRLGGIPQVVDQHAERAPAAVPVATAVLHTRRHVHRSVEVVVGVRVVGGAPRGARLRLVAVLARNPPAGSEPRRRQVREVEYLQRARVARVAALALRVVEIVVRRRAQVRVAPAVPVVAVRAGSALEDALRVAAVGAVGGDLGRIRGVGDVEEAHAPDRRRPPRRIAEGRARLHQHPAVGRAVVRQVDGEREEGVVVHHHRSQRIGHVEDLAFRVQEVPGLTGEDQLEEVAAPLALHQLELSRAVLAREVVRQHLHVLRVGVAIELGEGALGHHRRLAASAARQRSGCGQEGRGQQPAERIRHLRTLRSATVPGSGPRGGRRRRTGPGARAGA